MTCGLEIYATIVTPYCGFVLDLHWKCGLVLGLGWKHVDDKSEMHMGREVRWDRGEIHVNRSTSMSCYLCLEYVAFFNECETLSVFSHVCFCFHFGEVTIVHYSLKHEAFLASVYNLTISPIT
jgi:hypothetical protein